jgi:hypothetical protein
VPAADDLRALTDRAGAARAHADAVGAYEADVTAARESVEVAAPFDDACAALLDAREHLSHLAALLDALGRVHAGRASRAERRQLAATARRPVDPATRPEPDAVCALLDDAADELATRAARRVERRVQQASASELAVVTDLVERGITFEQLVQLLAGAHLLVPGRDVLTRWAALDGAHRRPSSHYRDATGADAGPQYGIAGRFTHEILFGPGPHGTTFVQLERAAPSPTALPRHLVDWVEYRASHRNQGPYGSSAFTDARPLHVQVAELDAGPVEIAAHLHAIAAALDATARAVPVELALDAVVGALPDAPLYGDEVHATGAALGTAAVAVRVVGAAIAVG